MQKNKIINILLISLLVLGFSACSDSKEATDKLIEKENKAKLPKPKWEDKLSNYKNTFRWYSEADNNEVAASNIGAIYSDEIKDYKKAIKWFLYSDSIKNTGDNSFNLGNIYKRMNNYDKAIKYYKKSFSQGNIEAGNNLGALYQKLKDYSKSENWYKKAIKKNNILSIQNLAILYHNNLKDDIKASAYYIALIDIEYSKKLVLQFLKDEWNLSDETIKKGYELQLKMEGLPRRYTGGI